MSLIRKSSIPFAIACSALSWAAVENLDEMVARKSRMTSSTFHSGEDANAHFIRQPMALCYADVSTGHEVWRLSSTRGLNSIYHDDIGVSPWSANGHRLAFHARMDTAAFDRDDYSVWWIVNADGSKLRPVIDGPSRVMNHSPYFHWSPQLPDVYYDFARNRAGLTGLRATDLYQATVSDDGVTRQLLLSFPTAHGTELFLNKTLSADGKKVIAMPWTENWWFPATIYPSSEARLNLADGYTSDRDMDSQWGDTPDAYTSFHDQYYAGDGSYVFVMASGSHAWWLLRVLGTAADGGSRYTFTPPSTFGEQIPVNTLTTWGGTSRDPFGSDYWSHFCPDRWGRYALFSSVDSTPISPGIWDLREQRLVADQFGTGGIQHHQWAGFSDWFVSSRGTDMIFTAKYNDEQTTQAVCNPHARYNGGSNYDTLPRPGQSPDGTKVAFHSEFLNAAANVNDVFWAVCYYPFPPKLLGAANEGTDVRLSWNSPKYTARGWPNEETDEVPEPKEIKYYHIWSSADGVSWSEVTTVGIAFGTNNTVVAQTPGTTVYYAMTSEEYSRLESRTLSNVLRVAVDNAGKIAQCVESASYPTNPGGSSGLWHTLPPAPTDFAWTPTGVAGQYRLTWTEPFDYRIRYYNIYYSSTGIPPADQKYRVASLPQGTDTWVDWCALSTGQGYYRITSVDRQGNEGLVPGSGVTPIQPTMPEVRLTW